MQMIKNSIDRNIRNFEEDLRPDIITDGVTRIHATKCGLCYTKCLKKQGINIGENRKLLKSLELRYDSWQQAVKEGWGRGVNYGAYNRFTT